MIAERNPTGEYCAIRLRTLAWHGDDAKALAWAYVDGVRQEALLRAAAAVDKLAAVIASDDDCELTAADVATDIAALLREMAG